MPPTLPATRAAVTIDQQTLPQACPARRSPFGFEGVGGWNYDALAAAEFTDFLVIAAPDHPQGSSGSGKLTFFYMWAPSTYALLGRPA